MPAVIMEIVTPRARLTVLDFPDFKSWCNEFHREYNWFRQSEQEKLDLYHRARVRHLKQEGRLVKGFVRTQRGLKK